MPKIILLDESTITKIAAGEVIERPASVVKELVENSLDAGATEITVKIKDGGKKQITVIDNGQGMDKEDILLCTKRHATSKIQSINDIYSIFSYGFRGEALATVAEVSKMEIISGTKTDSYSYKLVLEEGKQKEFVPTTKYQGTTINIYNLFYTIPARQKFLKSDSYEFKKICDWLKSITIPNIKIEFKLYNDTKLVFEYKKCDTIKQRIQEVFGLDVFEGQSKDPIVDAQVYYTNPTDLKELFGDTKQIFYVNNRPITNRTIAFAIIKAFETRVPKGRKPNVFVFLNISPKVIDVNVHPQKLEVRVKDDNTFFYPVYGALKNSLEKGIDSNTDEKRTKIISLLGQENNLTHILKDKNEINIPQKEKQTQTTFSFASNNIETKSKYKILGQYNNTYILVEDENESLLIIDQHVADERIHFENLSIIFERDGTIKSQQLILPLSLDFELEYLEIFTEYAKVFLTFGFDFDVLKDSILLRSIPVVLGRIPDKQELKEMLLEIANNVENQGKLKIDNLINNLRVSILTTLACKSAIKADTSLGLFEMKRIIDGLFVTKNPYTCPHGRPIIIELTKNEIYHKIGRK
ncbi:MAG: hypothetical protein COT14_00860 [Candidatus Diapherotrites archaeon CG08_land_8_20_14_0_20_30_16]|nr:MAG: hypothetical protein COT14_00860 [Candidatus Diapherotrites archaeon CG08_land_8_20_14_0_20_30_16]